MWQEHDQAAKTIPLLLTGADELVDDHLRVVGEISELRFPDNQGVRVGGRIAVLERQHRLF